MSAEGAEIESTSVIRQAALESDPLLGGGDHEREIRKPFYRPRPLWLVPFAVTSAIVRGMTLAPRIEIYTQLSCTRLHGHDPRYDHTSVKSTLTTTTTPIIPQANVIPFYYSLDPLGPTLYPHGLLWTAPASNYTLLSGLSTTPGIDLDLDDDPRNIPSNRCQSDPAVQAAAARLQTLMTTTMGLLSALTTGWWGHFGERHGRTKVLAIVTFGLFMTDLAFILVSTPSSPLSAHGHKLLLLAPIFEGALGGWSTLQSATHAYLSDCTSPGSRAQIFSRFAGVFYVGISLGPSIGGYFIQNPLFSTPTIHGRLSVTCVFWVAIVCSFINFLLVLFVFPESLDKVKRMQAFANHQGKGKARAQNGDISASPATINGREEGVVRAFLKPLALFLPVTVYDDGRRRQDWSLTFLGGALLFTMVSSGVYQLKYLYAVHIYGWSVDQLSHFISFMSASRAIFLLVIVPWIIAALKPRPQPSQTDASTSSNAKALKSKPTKAHLANEIWFDLLVTRCSLLVDIISNVFITLGPVPAVHVLGQGKMRSQTFFVLASGLSSLGSGAPPALSSLALCIMQMRSLDALTTGRKGEEGVGQLFGALAVLQTLGSMIAGPMLFGMVYSATVADFPKAVFVTAGSLLMSALVLALLVRGPGVNGVVKQGKGKGREERERGRSRVSKDLRGGAVPFIGYGSIETGNSP